MSVLAAVGLFAAGIAGGFINIVAGGGSVITIPALVEVVGASVANGTLRIAILMQMAAGASNYAGRGVMPWRTVMPLVPPTIAGAIGGAWFATQLSPDAIKKVFDTDNDGKISEKELSDNAAVKAVLAGDVDADKDGKKEELSIGIGFRASGCKIKMN